LVGYEGNSFVPTGQVEGDLLRITAVHPMREDAVTEFLARAGAGWESVEPLLAAGQLHQTRYQGHDFYLRRLDGSGQPRDGS
jgi:hypothetical protein